MRRFHLVSRIASKQAGVVSREQLLDLGLHVSAIQRALNERLLFRQHRGVYRLASARSRRDATLWTALLCAGHGAVLSHLTAAWHWQLEGLGVRPPNVVDVSIPARRIVAAAPNLRVHRVAVLEPIKDFAPLRGLPCTSIARTLLDLAAGLPADTLELAFHSAVRKNPDNREAVLDILERLPFRRGADELETIATREELEGTQSSLEDQVRIVLRAAGLLPMPQLQICDRSGEQIGIFDFAFPEANVVICCDSWSCHWQRHMFEKDRWQIGALEAAGWHPLPVTWLRIKSDPAGVVRQLRDMLAAYGPVGKSSVTDDNLTE